MAPKKKAAPKNKGKQTPLKKQSKPPKKIARHNILKSKLADVFKPENDSISAMVLRFAEHRGKPRLYTPIELLGVFHMYVKFVEANPLKEEKVFGSGWKTKINKLRAMSIAGFCTFATLTRATYFKYKKQKEYVDVCDIIDTAMYTQKFEGATADLMNHAIIARDLGLVDKTSLVNDEGEAIIAFNYIIPDKPKKQNNNEHED